MDELGVSDYYSLPLEDRNYIDDLINNLNVNITTQYEGLTEDLVLDSLNLDKEKVKYVIDFIRKFRIYSGYKPNQIFFSEMGLFIEESRIKSEEDFIEVLGNLVEVEDEVVGFKNISQKSIEKINSSIVEKKTSIYEDITPESLDLLIEKNKITLEQIFKTFKKITLMKGYKVIEISLTEGGLKIIQEAVKNEREYFDILNQEDFTLKNF